MTHLAFKDKSKYDKIPYSIQITTHHTKTPSGKIIVELSNITGNWHSLLPTEEEFETMNEEVKKEWQKYPQRPKEKVLHRTRI